MWLYILQILVRIKPNIMRDGRVAYQQSNVRIDTFDKVSEITVYDSIYSDEEDALGGDNRY